MHGTLPPGCPGAATASIANDTRPQAAQTGGPGATRPARQYRCGIQTGIAGRLHAELAIRKEDVLINLVEVKKENGYFGDGIAQYA